MSIIDSPINIDSVGPTIGTKTNVTSVISNEGKMEHLKLDSPDTSNNKKEKVVDKGPIAKGDTILTSVPFAFILKGSLKGLHCDNCLRKKQGLQRCSSCACSYYCNIDCQKTSWSIHKKECKKLKKLKPQAPPDTTRLIARVIFRLQDGGNEVSEKVHENYSRRFKDLMNHYQDVKNDPKKQEHFESTLVVLKSYLGDDLNLNQEELLDIFGRVYVNAFTMTDKDLNGVGLGVYLSASIFDHSCKPNAYASFNGSKLIVRALYDLPHLNYSKLRISYIDVLNTKEHRMKELQEGYFFTCDCPLCQDKTRDRISYSINCGTPGCLQPVYVGETDDSAISACGKCGFNGFDLSKKREYLDVLSLTKQKLDETKSDNYLQVTKMLLEKQGKLFHKLNLWRVRTLDAAFESAINLTVWDDSVAYGTQNLDGLKYYYGSNHPLYGLCLLKLAKIESYLFKMEEAYNHLHLAEPILMVSHGRENPIFYEDLLPLMKQVKQEIKMMQNSGFNVFKNKK